MRELFAGFFDDAALFPPGNAPMPAAVAAHRERRSDLVGPFLAPAARLGELIDAVAGGPPLAVALIAAAADLPAAEARVAACPELRLAAVETPVVPGAGAARETVDVLDSLPPDIPAAVEVPRGDHRDEVLDVLAGTRHRAKLRTGGLRAELFPPPGELAGTLHAAVARGVAVKCTAGLHRAIRHTDPATGFAHHGFLNVLAAAGALAGGARQAEAVELLRSTDPAALAPQPAARAVLTSLGTCDVREPIDDLVDLGLLPADDRIDR